MTPEDLGEERFRANGDEDSLLSNVELAVDAISSVLRDSDFKKSNALPFKEALALSLKGVASVSSRIIICEPLSWILIMH